MKFIAPHTPRRREVPALFTAGLSLLAFAGIACLVSNGGVAAFDNYVRQTVHAWTSPDLTQCMLAATFAGRIGFVAVLAVPFVWWLIKAGRLRDALWLVGTAATADLLLQILKFAFHRQRPHPFFGLEAPDSLSFPSGHALLSTVFYVTLAAIMTRRPSVRIAAAILAGLIGLSRIYLGVHYPSDVAAGYSAGVFWLAGCHLLRRSIQGIETG